MMKILRALSLTSVVLLVGLGLASAQNSTRPTNQSTFSQDASSAVVQGTAPVRQIGVRQPRSGPPYSNPQGAPLKLRARPRHTHKPSISGTITYTCDPNIDAKVAGTCSYLNTAIAGDYSSTFTNANANIYIQYGATGLGSSEQYFNFITYSQYVSALTSNPNQSAIQVAALSALATYDATPYGSGNVEVTGALATALGFPGMTGIQTDESSCTLADPGCYNAIITITNDPGITLYYDNVGGTEPADAYDFYTTVAHETDEVLGTSSCVSTQNPNGLTDGCGGSTPSAVDLYRYSGAGSLVLDSSLSTTPGAYFSYNGGTTNGANGVANTPKVYNTLDNGDDYADFVSSSPDCGTDQAVQDAEGCPGEDAGLTILNDGGGEINILNAVGYDVQTTANFSLSANPSSVTVTQGSSGTSTITITPSNGFSGSVTLSASGLPSGVTALFNPNPATTSSVLTLSASATATTGTVPVTISGTSGALTNTTPLSLTVNPLGKTNTNTSIASSVNPSLFGEAVTFTATVSITQPGIAPTGTVKFYDSTQLIATETLSGGQAQFTTSSLTVGSHFIGAVYSGDTNFNGSSSSALHQVVNQSATLIASPSSVSFGNVVVKRPKKQVVTLTNTGFTILNIGPISLTVTQGDASQFSIGHVCTPHLRPGRSCTIAVHFTPDAVGSDAATLNIASSAPGSPLEVPITGAGINK